jgi:LuxR family transcriptional regulator, regulator of acetate metabolism
MTGSAARAAYGDLRIADVLDEELRRRVVAALGVGRRLLGTPVQTGADPDAAEVGAVIGALVQRLAALPGGDEAAAAQSAHEARLAGLRQRFEARVGAVEQVHGAIARLREITAPSAMLAAAARELCRGSELERVILSAVRDGVMTAESVYFRDDRPGAKRALEALRASPVGLEHPLIETEVLRRRRATVVAAAQVQPRVNRRWAEIMEWESYVAAPVAIQSTVIAVIHADRGGARPLDVLHRDVLWEFTSGLAQAYESASLRRTLRREHEQMRQFLEWLNARSGELTEAAIELVPRERPGLPPPQPLDAKPAQGGRDDSAVFAGVLTRRELEVLRLLGEGRTNRAIADELVISGGTVKFHVNSILRKLHVANRAEAVSRYYALLGVRPGGG